MLLLCLPFLSRVVSKIHVQYVVVGDIETDLCNRYAKFTRCMLHEASNCFYCRGGLLNTQTISKNVTKVVNLQIKDSLQEEDLKRDFPSETRCVSKHSIKQRKFLYQLNQNRKINHIRSDTFFSFCFLAVSFTLVFWVDKRARWRWMSQMANKD